MDSIKSMKFYDCILLFKKKKNLVLVITLLMTFIGGFTSFAIPPTYKAKSDVIVKIPASNLILNEYVEKDLHLIEAYQHLMKSNSVLKKVNLSLNESYEKNELHKKVELEYQTPILTIRARESSPEKAKQLANTLASTFQEEVRATMNSNHVSVLNDATVEDGMKSITPVTVLFFGISAIVGFLLSYAFILIQDMFLTVLDSSEKVEKGLKLPVIGVLPLSEGVLVHDFPSDHKTTKSFRLIQKKILEILSNSQGKTLLVSSAESGDGKSYISANLSVAFASNQKKTVYVDADLRRATGHRLFEYPSHMGVTTFLLDECDVNDIIQLTKHPNLFYISAGPVQLNPSELLSSEKFSTLIEELRGKFDVIIVDTPPLIFVETLKITTMVDGCLYVVNAETSKLEKAIHFIEQVKLVQANLLGIIVNKSKETPQPRRKKLLCTLIKQMKKV